MSVGGDIWFSIAMFLTGVVVTLLGAWAVHSVTQGQLNSAITSQEKLFSANLEAVKNMIGIMDKKMNEMQKQLDRRMYPRTSANLGSE